MIGFLGSHHLSLAHRSGSILEFGTLRWLEAFTFVYFGILLGLLDLIKFLWVLEVELEGVVELLVGHADELEDLLDHVLEAGLVAVCYQLDQLVVLLHLLIF